MAACKECKNYFPLEDQTEKGDCVRRQTDPRQAFYTAKPVSADNNAASCSEFQKKQV